MRKKISKCIRYALAILCVHVLTIYLVAIFSQPPLIGRNCLPEYLQEKKHVDYVYGIRWIPWRATSWCLVEPPITLLKRQNRYALTRDGRVGLLPVPRPGQWHLAIVQIKPGWPLYLPYFTITAKNGYHFRIGCRWDNSDHYYVFPSLSIKYIG